MKKTILMVMCVIGGISWGAAAEPVSERRAIEVTGEGVSSVEPDQITLRFHVETSHKNLAQARDENATRTNNVLSALKKFPIATKDIQSPITQITPRYDYVNGRSVFRDYAVTKQFVVVLRTLSEYGKVLNALIEVGVDQLNAGEFGSSKSEGARAEARKKAIVNAREKAEALAAELRQKVGVPLFIQEGVSASPIRPFHDAMMMRAKAAASEDTVVPGELDFRANVTVRFELQ